MKRIFNITLILALLLCYTSCDKYLEVDPDVRAELNSPEALRELLATAYPQASYVIIAESMSDNFSDKGIFANSITNPVNRDVYLYKETIESNEEDSPNFYWGACYKAIAAANQALKYIEESGSPKSMLSAKGEALLCRAYAHFMLSVFFARTYSDVSPSINPGIPYIKEVETVVIKKYDRGTVQSMYDNMQADIEQGLELLTDGEVANEAAAAYHFSRKSAYAFATRFYLFKKDYENVIKYSKLLFPDMLTLSTMIRDVVSYRPLPYYVLAQTWTSTTQLCNLLLATAPSLVHNYPYYRYGANGAFATGFMWREPPISSAQWAWNLYGQENLYNIPKYRNYKNMDTDYNICMLFTADEVAYNWAEASVMIGDFETATNILKEVFRKKAYNPTGITPVYNLSEADIQRAYSSTTSSDRTEYFINAVLDFKRREYAFEGMRWMDMVRHRIPVRHVSNDLVGDIIIGANDPRRILQIPIEVQMSGVERNPR